MQKDENKSFPKPHIEQALSYITWRILEKNKKRVVHEIEIMVLSED